MRARFGLDEDMGAADRAEAAMHDVAAVGPLPTLQPALTLPATESPFPQGENRGAARGRSPPPNAKSTELIAVDYWANAGPTTTYPISIGAMANRSKLGSTGLLKGDTP